MKLHVAIAILLLLAGFSRAETIKLKDGTVLEGTVIKQGDKYWIKTPDGESRTIPASEVEVVGAAAKQQNDDADGQALPSNASHEFLATKRKADAVDTPIAAVSIWQAFIEKSTSESDKQAAQTEMDKWQQLADGNAEKIHGKWIGGEERKAILQKHHALMTQGWDLLRSDQTLPAMKKLEEAAKVYPNSFEVNFLIGYLMMLQRKEEAATRYFEQALRVRPNAPEALANLGLIHLTKKQHARAIQTMYRAVQNGDSKEMTQNLINAIAGAPPAVQNSYTVKQASEAARLLAVKYGIKGPTQQLMLVPLRPESMARTPDEDAMAGATSSGTGFVINDEGLIVTNRHVVDEGKTIMVVTSDQKKRAAEVVVIDDEQDLALIRIKPEGKIPFLQFSGLDSPADGAECTVMGFPMLTRLGASIKITRGIVSSSSDQNGFGADVLIDAKVNPGNSGGPILDRYGNVMAVVSMKSLASASEESYGMGISAGRVRKFLTKNKITLPAADATEAPSLSTEEIAAKVKPATVCILVTY